MERHQGVCTHFALHSVRVGTVTLWNKRKKLLNSILEEFKFQLIPTTECISKELSPHIHEASSANDYEWTGVESCEKVLLVLFLLWSMVIPATCRNGHTKRPHMKYQNGIFIISICGRFVWPLCMAVLVWPFWCGRFGGKACGRFDMWPFWLNPLVIRMTKERVVN